MTRRLVRFRILAERLVLDGISLPRGDYDGEISWADLPLMGRLNRVPGPATITFAKAFLEASGQSTPQGKSSFEIDIHTAIKRGEAVVL